MGTRVLLVEDHLLMAQSLRAALESEGMEVLTSPLDSAESVLACAREHAPDVVLLDLLLRGDLPDGQVLVAPLVEQGCQVLVVSGTDDRMRIAKAVEAGAAGVVGKEADFEVLLDAVRDAVALQELILPSQRTELLLDLHRQRQEDQMRLAAFRSLTPREAQVLAALMDGQAAAAIARDTFVTEATVRTQIRAVLAKLGVNSQLEAVAAARRAGWEPAA